MLNEDDQYLHLRCPLAPVHDFDLRYRLLSAVSGVSLCPLH